VSALSSKPQSTRQIVSIGDPRTVSEVPQSLDLMSLTFVMLGSKKRGAASEREKLNVVADFSLSKLDEDSSLRINLVNCSGERIVFIRLHSKSWKRLWNRLQLSMS
jgi:hypothetical protein